METQQILSPFTVTYLKSGIHAVAKMRALCNQLSSLMLVALEQQLQNQNGPSASASDSSSANPGQMTVKVPRERKLGKFAGSRDDRILEEWIGDATRAIAGQTDADGMDFLPYHLDSVAKEEVRLHPAEKRAIPATVFKVPRDCFSEGLTNTQASWKFFKKRQRDYESVSADLPKVISELVVGQKILAKQIQCQQAALERQQQAIFQLSMGSQQW
ncbi:unnamed protein product [Porites lobata]|uniref:Uncharacterized protein n=1 Tax=Porites lobata TaxID=104759 RepID=A0ABN8MTI0_9CNID|nr:unnamed protein product [Porites lobata]